MSGAALRLRSDEAERGGGKNGTTVCPGPAGIARVLGSLVWNWARAAGSRSAATLARRHTAAAGECTRVALLVRTTISAGSALGRQCRRPAGGALGRDQSANTNARYPATSTDVASITEIIALNKIAVP